MSETTETEAPAPKKRGRPKLEKPKTGSDRQSEHQKKIDAYVTFLESYYVASVVNSKSEKELELLAAHPFNMKRIVKSAEWVGGPVFEKFVARARAVEARLASKTP